jgi:hypothetical protein
MSSNLVLATDRKPRSGLFCVYGMGWRVFIVSDNIWKVYNFPNVIRQISFRYRQEAPFGAFFVYGIACVYSGETYPNIFNFFLAYSMVLSSNSKLNSGLMIKYSKDNSSLCIKASFSRPL